MNAPRYQPQVDPQVSFRLTDSDVFTSGHPYGDYARLRESAPVSWQDDGPGYWLVTRHEDISEVSMRPDVYSSADGFNMTDQKYELMGERVATAMRRIVISMDPPEHTKLRQLIMPFFTQQRLAALEAATTEITARHLDDLSGAGDVDIVDRFSAPVPIEVLTHTLGVPEEDRGLFRDWTDRMVGASDPDQVTSPEDALGGYLEVFAYGGRLTEERRAAPRDDLVSEFANATIDGRPVSQAETDGFFALMIGAGNETTRNALTGALMALDAFPDQRRLLVERPELIDAAVDELLRFVTPVIHMRRTATRDTDLGGQRIAAGERVALLYGAANRDPDVFEHPDTVDIERANARAHLAFGIGPHRCLGAALARRELKIALGEFLARFPDYRVTGEARYLRSFFVHGIKSLPVRLAG